MPTNRAQISPASSEVDLTDTRPGRDEEAAADAYFAAPKRTDTAMSAALGVSLSRSSTFARSVKRALERNRLDADEETMPFSSRGAGIEEE